MFTVPFFFPEIVFFSMLNAAQCFIVTGQFGLPGVAGQVMQTQVIILCRCITTNMMFHLLVEISTTVDIKIFIVVTLNDHSLLTQHLHNTLD